MANLNIYRGASVLYTVGIDESTVYSGQVIGENKVTANFTSPVKLTLLIGDYIQHNGQTFKLNKSVDEQKLSSFEYKYSAIFEGLEYSLYNKVIEHLGTADFSYFGTPDTFLDLIIDNINIIDAGWEKGDVEVIEGGKFVSFENESCRQALTKVAEAFELEFSFDGKIINLVKTVGVDTDIVFEYGQGNGLDSLIRKPVNDQQFGTRFIGYGSTQNIPADYRDGKKRLSFDPGYIDKNVATYGIIERPVVFDYIFPRRTGTITATPTNLQIVDSTLDFNLNDVIVDGKAKIVFKSGDLQGNEFEIASYNNTTKTVFFNANVEENGYTLPNDTVKPAVGDTYTFIGIEMPESYITAAETELQEATEEYAEAFKNPFYAYDLPINEKFIRDNNLVGALNRGDRVRVIDTDMSVDTTLRVQAISYPLCNPGKISATINDTVSYTVAERILKTISKQKQQISVVYKNVAEVNRDLAIRQREFQNKVFDPDGYFDGGKIKPETIEALSIASGARSQQFTLSVIFQPNYEADPNAVYWSAGNLVHNTIDDSGIKIWSLTGGNRTDLSTLEVYYAYAKCLKDGNTGTIVFDTVARRVNDDPDFYYFLIGQLSSVIGGVRWPQFTYGTSTVNGRFLTTGRIQSADLQNYIDLDTNQFNFGNNISGIDYNVTTLNQLTVRGHIEATSGTIAGVEINAGNNFNLNGSRVIIKPNEGIKIYNDGYLKVPSSPPYSGALATGEAAIWIGDLSGITTVPGSDYTLPIASASVLGGVKIGSGLTRAGDGTISVTALGGVTSFNTRTGAITLQSADVTGALGYTPYNSSNPSGYITSSALTPYALSSAIPTDNSQLYNGAGYITAAGNVNSAANWGSISAPSAIVPSIGYFLTTDATGNVGQYSNASAVQAVLGLNNGSTLNNSISGNASTASNAQYWSGIDFTSAFEDASPSGLLGYYGTGTTVRRTTPTGLTAFLGLGSNAFTSTAYQPLLGYTPYNPASYPVNAGGETFQSVTDRGGKTTNFLKISGVSYLRNGDGLELFWDGENSCVQSYGRGTSNAAQPLQFFASQYTFLNGNVTAPTFIGALTGNATTATTLQTSRTLWGQSFNGSGNVSGALTGVTDLTASGTILTGVLKATSVLKIPTTAPPSGALASGEAAFWIGDLSGITT